MDEELKAIDGTELLGFVMPKDLPGVLQDAGCMLLPSRFEPWGVVVHEAIASGLAVICTSACGSASRLVNDGYNGRVIAPDKVDEMVEAMRGSATPTPRSGSRSASAAPSSPSSTRRSEWRRIWSTSRPSCFPRRSAGEHDRRVAFAA